MMNDTERKEFKRYADAYDPVTHFCGGIRESGRYAALLLARAEEGDVTRAGDIVTSLMALQTDDPDDRNHGQFPMQPGGETGDLNAVLFFMPSLIGLLRSGPGALPPEQMNALDTCVRKAVIAIERRWDEERFDRLRDFKAYTNVFLLYIQGLLLAGTYYDDKRLQRTATAQWQRWFNHISYVGIDELSPSYSNVDYEALLTIHDLSPDAQMRQECSTVLQYLSALYHAITHPVLRLPVCGTFRHYREFLSRANCEPDCVSRRAHCAHAGEAVRADYEARLYPCAVRGRATTMPFRFQSWQDVDVSMGSMTGGNYFWQQIHCMVAVGKNENDRAVMFMPGQYTPTSGFVAQHELEALCVFSREPNALHRTQYPMPDSKVHSYQRNFGIGFDRGWRVRQNDDSSLVLSAFGYDVHIRPFVLNDGGVEPVTLRRTAIGDMGQQGFHRGACEFEAFVFPVDAVRFGCHVVTCKAGQDPAPRDLSSHEDQRVLTVAAGAPHLRIRLFQQPSGELTELYDDDWRTVPLLQSPAYTLWPGELTHRATTFSPQHA